MKRVFFLLALIFVNTSLISTSYASDVPIPDDIIDVCLNQDPNFDERCYEILCHTYHESVSDDQRCTPTNLKPGPPLQETFKEECNGQWNDRFCAIIQCANDPENIRCSMIWTPEPVGPSRVLEKVCAEKLDDGTYYLKSCEDIELVIDLAKKLCEEHSFLCTPRADCGLDCPDPLLPYELADILLTMNMYERLVKIEQKTDSIKIDTVPLPEDKLNAALVLAGIAAAGSIGAIIFSSRRR